MDRANELLQYCPYCSGKVYAGVIQGKCPKDGVGAQSNTGLVFTAKSKPNPHKDWFGRHFLSKMLGNKSWTLSGAHVRARSCGKCHRLFIWGFPVDRIEEPVTAEGESVRYCPYCAETLLIGALNLSSDPPTHVRFVCDTFPELHSDWIGRNILDRYVFNRWKLTVKSVPALSCPSCSYTEVSGKPVYRFG